MTTEVKSSNDLRYKATKTIGNETIYVSISLNDECKNGHQDFSITANLFEANKPKVDRYHISGGCIHDEIMKFFPEFKMFIDLHLCDYKGIPMHAVANGWYHLHNGFNNTPAQDPKFRMEYCDYYRLSPQQFKELTMCETQLQFAIALKETGILAQWEAEANHAIEKLEELTGTKFLVDSRLTQYHGPSEEELVEENKKQADGYYSPEAKAERERAAQHAAIAKLEAERDAAIAKATKNANAKYDTLKQVLSIGGSVAFANGLWHDHSMTFAFNWRGYNNISDELYNLIASNIVLPEGVKLENSKDKR